MAGSRDFLAEIRAVTNSLPSNLTSTTSIDNIYEVYLLTLVLRAAEAEGATISIKDQDNQYPRRLFFRSSPGYIASNLRDYTYAEIEFPNKPILESHVSIRVSGKSNVLHECDVCVLYKSEADLCRRSRDRIAPRSNKLIINLEAKFYTTSLTLNLGRSFIGLVADLSSDDSFFVTNTYSTSIEKLLSNRNKKWGHNVKPNTDDTNELLYAIKSTFKNYKAK